MRVLPPAADAAAAQNDRKSVTGGAAVETDRAPRPAFPRIPCLDGVRAVAVLIVIAHHAFLSTPVISPGRLDSIIDRVMNEGYLGVDLFFVLSGYLITSILDRTRDAESRTRTFYARRVLRIFPLYYAFLIVSRIFFLRYEPAAAGPPGSEWWHVFYLTNLGYALKGPLGIGAVYVPYWSLAVEEHFYLLWPLTVFRLTRPTLIRFCGIVAIASLLLSLSLSVSGQTVAAYVLTPSHLYGLLIGAWVALMQRENPAALELHAARFMKGIGALLVIDVLLGFFLGRIPGLRLQIFLAGPFVFGASVALLVLGKGGAARRALGSAPMRAIGKYSYAMYVFHIALVHVAGILLIEQRHPVGGYFFPYRILWALGLIGASFTAGFVSWNVWEKHFLKIAPPYRGSRTAGVRGSLAPA